MIAKESAVRGRGLIMVFEIQGAELETTSRKIYRPGHKAFHIALERVDWISSDPDCSVIFL